VTPATRATPMVKAAAVRVVRVGSRVAFSRASRPVTPRNRASGAPTARAVGPASSGPRTNTPMKTNAAPVPTRAISGWSRPRPTSTAPSPVTTNPAVRRRAERPPVSTDTSRIAWRGAIRDAPTAGSSADAIVMATPTTTATMTVRVNRTMPPAGRSKPINASPSRNRNDRPMPATTPSAEATRPTTRASAGPIPPPVGGWPPGLGTAPAPGCAGPPGWRRCCR
jgi:hypothetical protein